MKTLKTSFALAAAAALALGVAACGDDDEDGGETSSGLSGEVRIDGSSTVAPLSEAIAERFNEENPDVDVTVGTSGTGGGFEKFCAGETDISDASRAIEAEEEELCSGGGVAYEEVVVANDGLTVVGNPQNPVTCLTVDQLADIWGPDTTVASWSDVPDLDAELAEEMQRYGPGTDSGTFDYFTEAINGEEGVQTRDYNNVGEDDNATVTGVAGSPGGIGYFGYSFFLENEGTLKAFEVENPDTGECVAPSEESVQSGDYAPLGRQLFIYPSADALEDETVRAFVEYYVDNVNEVAPGIGFIALTDEQLAESQDEVARLAGS